MLFIIFWIVIIVILLINYNNKLIFYAPLFVVLFKLSTQLISLGKYNEYVIIIDYLLIFFIVFLCIIELKRNYRYIKDKKLFKLILLFIIYLFVSIFFNSSDLWLSFKRGLNILVSLILFLAIYYNRNSLRYFYIGINSAVLYIVLFAFNFIILSVLKVGPSLNEFTYMRGYSESFLKTGNFGFFELHGVLIATSIYLILRKFIRNNLLKYLLLISFFAIVFLVYFSYKRTFALEIIVGFLIFYLLYMFRGSFKLKRFFIAFFSILFLYIFSIGYIKSFIYKRAEANSVKQIEESGRLMEFILYPAVVFKEKKPLKFLVFGKETLNSAGKFEVLNVNIALGKDRFLHNDFAHLLYGLGLIGLFLYLNFMIIILIKSYKRTKIENYSLKLVSIAAYIITLEILLSGLGDGILAYNNRVVPFFLLGLFLNIIENKILINEK